MADRRTTFTYRLSCGCLTAFYLPPKTGATVVCDECLDFADVQERYPSLSSSCGAMARDQGGFTLRCTNPKGCTGPWHYDKHENQVFQGKARLRSSTEGNTGKI